MKIEFASLLIINLLLSGAGYAQQDQTKTITSGGIQRTFDIHYPGILFPEQSPAVLISYHGSGGTSAGQAATDGFKALADKYKFIVVYPQAAQIDGTAQWNVYVDDKPGHGGVGDVTAPDDIQFTRDMINSISGGIDHKRIFATGLSNGAFMCYALSMLDAGEITAIAPVAGNLWADDNYLTTLLGSGTLQPIPVMHIHGTADNVVDYPDPDNTPKEYEEYPLFVAARGCGALTYSSVVPIMNTVDKLVFCPPPVEVSLIRITGMGHAWTNGIYPTSDSIVKFFHLESGPTAVSEPPEKQLYQVSSTIADGSIALSLEAPASIELCSILGTVVYSSRLPAGAFQIPTAAVADNIYLLKITTASKHTTIEKILVRH